MGAVWTQVSGPGGGVVPAGDCVLCASGRGIIWSSVKSQAAQIGKVLSLGLLLLFISDGAHGPCTCG